MGSVYRDQLIIQFLVEAFLLAPVEYRVGGGIGRPGIAGFNGLIQKQLQLALGTDVVINFCFGFALLVGLLAGLYPAFVSFFPQSCSRDEG